MRCRCISAHHLSMILRGRILPEFLHLHKVRYRSTLRLQSKGLGESVIVPIIRKSARICQILPGRSMLKYRATEKDLRDWFTQQGWDGKSGRFEELKLIAIERPGWVQVFQFCGTIFDENNQKHNLCGYCRDDERSQKFDVVYGESFTDLHTNFAEWTSGLVTKSRCNKHPVQIALIILFVVCLSLLMIWLAIISLATT